MSTNTILFIALIAVMLLSTIAQGKVQSTFRKYLDERASSGITASQMAREMLQTYGQVIPIQQVQGELTDHYDPSNNTVGLSTSVYGSDSVSALAVAAHEIGHVLQFQTGYDLITKRNKILPVASFASSSAPFIVMIGLLMGSYKLAMVGVILFATVLLFQLITLPMEMNASKRGLQMLQEGSYISEDQVGHAQEVLKAAAMTYVWATVASLVSLLRLLMIANSARRDD